MTIHALALCVLFLVGGTAFAQAGSEEGATVNRQDAGAGTVAQYLGDGATQSVSQSDQTQTLLPNAPSASRQPSSVNSLTFGNRLSIYGHEIFRPYTLVGPALGAGIGQWENEPPEWGQGGEGYARRFASGVGRHVIAETIRFGFAAADGEDPRYRRSSDESGVWSRAQHAIVETFTSQTRSGTRIPAFSRFAGMYGAAFISNTWYPEHQSHHWLCTATRLDRLGSSLGFHLFEEFVPRKYFKALHVQD